MKAALKEFAKRLYTQDLKEIQVIATDLEVSEAEIRQLIQEGGWDGLRQTSLTSKEQQLKLMYALLDKVNAKMTTADDVNPKDAELAIKYTAAIKNLDIELGIPEVVEVGKSFTTWLREQDAELSKEVARRFDAFLKFRLKNTGL